MQNPDLQIIVDRFGRYTEIAITAFVTPQGQQKLDAIGPERYKKALCDMSVDCGHSLVIRKVCETVFIDGYLTDFTSPNDVSNAASHLASLIWNYMQLNAQIVFARTPVNA